MEKTILQNNQNLNYSTVTSNEKTSSLNSSFIIHNSSFSSASGFSLMELMVVIVLMLIILASVFTLMRGTISTANTNFEMTSAAQNLRTSHEFITRDILTVGDGLRGVSNIWLPTKFVTKNLTVRSADELDPSNTGFVNVGAVITDNDVPANVNVPNTNPAVKVQSPSDRITLLAVDRSFNPIDIPVNASNYNTGKINIPATRVGEFSVGEIYYITGGGTGTFGTVTSIDTATNSIFWAEGDAPGLNRYGTTGPLGVATNTNLDAATLMRVVIAHYFVDSDGKLVRRAFGVKSESFVDSVIAEHILDLQFRYMLKPTTAGTIMDQPADQLELNQATRVRIIEPYIIAETAYPLDDGTKKRVDGATQIGVRNIQFLEAPVPLDKVGNTTLINPGPTPKITPTPSPTPVPTPKLPPGPTPTPNPTPNPGPTKTPTPVPTKTPTPVPTPTRTPTPTPTPKPGKGEG